MQSLFQVEHLQKVIQEHLIIEDISLTLEAGEIFVLVGESGAGKSTLLQVLSCLTPASSGRIWLDGKDITGSALYLIPGHADIKLVPQEYRLLPNHTVRENITYALREYTKEYQHERLSELLQLTGLERVQNKLPREISGGEKQRTAIARAIADEPKVLLLDEPFSNLDTLNQQKLKREFQRIIQETGIACLFVTHDLLDALTVSDRMGVMHKGRILQSGTATELLHNPVNEYVRDFLTSGLAILEEVKQRLL
ncbi:MAG: ABC transporter ATP-binding protein [Siphonobacter sp.]